MIRRPPRSTLFPYTRSSDLNIELTGSIGIALSKHDAEEAESLIRFASTAMFQAKEFGRNLYQFYDDEMNARTLERSEEHTSELQSRLHLVCRLLLEKKKTKR